MSRSARRKTISRSELESFLIDIDEPEVSSTTSNDENRCNIPGITGPKDPLEKKPATVDIINNNISSPLIKPVELAYDQTLDISHAVRLFVRVSACTSAIRVQ